LRIKGVKSHEIISQALEILKNLDHRGAVGADPLLGDGAGILIQLPDALLRDWADKAGVSNCPSRALRRGHVLPAAGRGQPALHRRHFRKVHRQGRSASDRLARCPVCMDGLGKAVIDRCPSSANASWAAATIAPIRTPSSASCWPSASRRRTR
jgi:glutamate synthase (NADPH/NADH) large chain